MSLTQSKVFGPKYTQCTISPMPTFCLGTGAPRHNAGGIGSSIYYIHGTHRPQCAAQVKETEKLLHSYYMNIFIVVRWRSEMIMGFL